MITIIDYGMGNLKSLINAFQFLEEKVKIVDNSKEIEKAKEEIKNRIVELSLIAAAKAINDDLNEEKHHKLIMDFINKVGV